MESLFASKAEVGKKYLSKTGMPVLVLAIGTKDVTVESLSNGHKTLKIEAGAILRPFAEKEINKMAKAAMAHPAKVKTEGLQKRLTEAKGQKTLSTLYKEKKYTVEVKADGFYYSGARYGSLSKVAEKITGHPTSGPAFFGLRDVAKKSNQGGK